MPPFSLVPAMCLGVSLAACAAAHLSEDLWKMMELLARAVPISPAVRRDLEFFDTAEVVGRWVWIEFTKKRPAEVTRVLAELGFHWNNVRKAWQHPCGLYCDRSLNFDPRRKYGSYFAAAVKAT